MSRHQVPRPFRGSILPEGNITSVVVKRLRCTKMFLQLSFIESFSTKCDVTLSSALPILRVGHGGQRGYKHFKTKPRVSCRDETNESLCLALLCWCWRHAACIPPDTNSACSGPKLKVPLHSAHTGSMFPTTLWESPRSKIQSFIPFVGNIGHFDDEFVLARLGAWKA